MKLGLSTHSFSRAIRAKQMSVLDTIQWIADHGGQHVEIVPNSFDLIAEPQLIEAICKKTAETGLDISSYTVAGNFISASDAEYEQKITHMCKQVDIANSLGVKLMRHDVAKRPVEDATIAAFNADLPKFVQACTRVADYAAQFGVTTSVENHGYHLQASERILTLIQAVERANFRLTLDVGNFMYVDEDPVASVKKSIRFASMIHLKDNYVRPSYRNPGEGWGRSAAGNYLRGAIVGQGDIDLHEIMRVIKHSGYDGYLSIEFEGMEDGLLGSRIGLNNALRIWNEV